MKKSLVLAMAMALGVTASAYAANPFSDVPAGHWAYDSVAKLAAAGVVDGYADGAFDGDKLMTRYEMAQIVAKAMAKGANVDKLAAEFADELDNLGVRVAKLEKAADNVKISGFLRLRYRQSDLDGDHGDMRSRIFITGQVNDDWSYTGMIQNDTTFTGHDSKGNNLGDNSEEDTDFKRAYLDGKIGGVTVRAGRWDEIPHSGAVLDAYLDGVKASYGKDIKVWGLLSKATSDAENLTVESSDRLYVAGVETTVGPVDVYGAWYKASEVDYGGYQGEKEVYNIGLGMNVAKDTRLTYEYMWGDDEYVEEVSKDGYIVGLNFRGADTAVAGTYGLHAYYYDQPVNAWLCPTFDLNAFSTDGGYEGWSVGADYTLAKNMLLSVNYYDTEAKVGSDDDQRLYTELYCFF